MDTTATSLPHFDSVVLAELLLVLAAICLALIVAVFERQRALAKVRAEDRSFRDLYNNISEGVFRSTLDGRMISANPALVRLNGFENEREMLESVNDIAGQWYVESGRRSELHEILLADGKVTNFRSEVYRYKSRERIWIEESTRLVRDERTGKPLYYDGTLREVTEAVRRQRLQERYDNITSMIGGCLYQARIAPDGTSSMPYASVGLTNIYGVKPEAVADDASMLTELIHPDDRARVIESFKRSAETLQPRQTEYRVITVDGVEKWVFGQSVPVKEPDGSILWHGFITDVSERKRSEARIYDLAYFDPLTKLPNRPLLLERLNQAMSASNRSGAWGALLFIDLDQFKVLNDTKGHHFGDQLLSEVARRLRTAVRTYDVVARLGGDEFVVLLQQLSYNSDEAADQARRIGSKILTAIAEPFALEGFPFHTTASVGVALFLGNRIEVDELLKRADLAMYEAKAEGRGSIRFFEARMQEEVEERLALTTELRDAIDRGNLELAYQVQVGGEGCCTGAEALLRWRHSVREGVEPAVFIPLAERGGLMGRIDEFVLDQACNTLRQWVNDPATRGLQLAVNVSPHQLRNGFIATLQAAMTRTDINPNLLTLELTEHVMLDDMEEVAAVILKLKEMGLKLALDDFGTGYSSLSYLKRLPIDSLKIDRSFIRDIETDPSDRAIVQTIVNIARSLDVAVLAEGVENQMQLTLLRQLGCHAYQGYLFGRPMPLKDFTVHIGAMTQPEPELRRWTA